MSLKFCLEGGKSEKQGRPKLRERVVVVACWSVVAEEAESRSFLHSKAFVSS